MPDGLEQRRFVRYPIQLPFLHTPKSAGHGRTEGGWTRNLSEGGACVELAEHLQSRMPLRVRLRSERGAIEAEAQVVWAGGSRLGDGGILHGVVFTQIAPEQLHALRDLILIRGLVRQAGVRVLYEVTVTCQRRGESGPPLEGRTRDISRGGVLLRLPQVLPPGEALELTLHTPRGPLKADGTVIWVAPPEGRTPGGPIRHGFQVTALDWSTVLSLGLVLAESV